MTLQEFRNHMNPRFSYMESAIDSIYFAIQKKQHCLLFGPGGHAKSTIVEEAIKLFIGEAAFYKDVFIANCAEDMDSTPIMGYDDIPSLKAGKLKKVLDDTVFLKNDYAILEEGLDAPPMLINALKDPLMRGYVCINGTCMPNRLKSLFICTNVDPVKWAGKDNSRLALLQRFTYSIEVKWPSYDYKHWEGFLKKRSIHNPIIAKFAEIAHIEKWEISPRSVEKMSGLYTEFGIQALENFERIPANVLQKWKDYEKNIPFIKEICNLQLRVEAMRTMPLHERGNEMIRITKIARSIKGIPVDGGFSEQLKQCLVDAKAIANAAVEAADQVTKTVVI